MILFFSPGLVETCLKVVDNYGQLFVFWAGPYPIVILGSPEYVQVNTEET
jgi:hypothetical protein